MGPHNACALDAGVSKGLAGAEPGETQGPARGGRGGGPGEPCVQCRVALSLGLALGLRRAPARSGDGAWSVKRHCPPLGFPKARNSSTLPYLSSNSSPRAVVAQTPLWNFGSWGGRGKHVYEKTWAQEVCGKRAQLVGGWKFCPARRKSRRFLAHTYTGWEGVKPAAGELPPL